MYGFTVSFTRWRLLRITTTWVALEMGSLFLMHTLLFCYESLSDVLSCTDVIVILSFVPVCNFLLTEIHWQRAETRCENDSSPLHTLCVCVCQAGGNGCRSNKLPYAVDVHGRTGNLGAKCVCVWYSWRSQLISVFLLKSKSVLLFLSNSDRKLTPIEEALVFSYLTCGGVCVVCVRLIWCMET